MNKRLPNISTAKIMKQLKHWFDLLGWPQTISTHGGPHFRKDLTTFCENNNITHNCVLRSMVKQPAQTETHKSQQTFVTHQQATKQSRLPPNTNPFQTPTKSTNTFKGQTCNRT